MLYLFANQQDIIIKFFLFWHVIYNTFVKHLSYFNYYIKINIVTSHK